MDKKVIVLIHQGLPYRKTIRYGSERAREIGAKLVLLAVVPEVDDHKRMALAVHEFGLYETVSKRFEAEAVEFLERAVQFALDTGITVDTMVERGDVQEIVKQVVKDPRVRLVLVPTPTKKEHHRLAFIYAISQFSHNMLEHELRCPVISVLAT